MEEISMLKRILVAVFICSYGCSVEASCWWRHRVVVVEACPVVTYASLKPQMDRINFAIVPIEKVLDICDLPPDLLRKALQLEEDVLDDGVKMITKQQSPEVIQRRLCETERELLRVRLELECYLATHCPNKICYTAD
jgi:hypothetical protein